MLTLSEHTFVLLWRIVMIRELTEERACDNAYRAIQRAQAKLQGKNDE